MVAHEKHVEYDGVSAHISTPENPTGLVFLVPGNKLTPDVPFLKAIKNACEDKGQVVVSIDLSAIDIMQRNVTNIHDNFTDGLRKVIDGYCEGNNFLPDEFELIGHSISGAAVLTVASEYPVSAVTVLDPMPVASEILQDMDCPVNVIISKVRSYRNPGKRMFNELSGYSDQHALHEVETSKDMQSGHIFEGQEDEVAQIIRDYRVSEYKPDDPDVSSCLDGPT